MTHLTLSNSGTITGTNFAGIDVDDDANITNAAGATITGGERGVNAEAGLMLTNDGTITSQSGDAVNIDGDGGVVINAGTITSGAGNGIIASGGGNTFISNSGTIDASSGINGVSILDAAPGDVVTNLGTITAADNGVEFVNGTGGLLNNTGTITGGNRSFFGSAGDDTLDLRDSSTLQGDVEGAGGVDTIAFGSSTLAPGNTGNSISGNISGIDSITKADGGVALIGLPGDPLVTVNADTITVLPGGGGLYINGNINAEDGISQSTFTSDGAAIGGTGTWNADVFVNTGGISAGAIPINLDADPTNAVGEVTITGSVVHQPGSFIRFDVDPNTGNTDLINQTGAGSSYTLNGADLRIASTDNNRVIQDGSYTVISNDDVINGQFGTISVQLNPNVTAADTGFVGSQVDPTALGASNNLDTVLATQFTTQTATSSIAAGGVQSATRGFTIQHDFSSLVTDPNAVAFGNALDASVGSGNAIDQDFIAALDFSDLATVQATLNAANPTATFDTTAAIVSANYGLNRRIQNHLAFTRAAGNTVRSFVGDFAEPTPSQPAPAARGGGNVWGSFSYDYLDVDSNTGNDLDGENASFTAGIDYRIAPKLVLGIVLEGSTADFDFDNGGDSDVDSFRAAIYGTYGEATGIYADFLVGYGSHDVDLSRNAGLLGNVNSSPDADSFQALITVGYNIQSNKIKHGPFGGFEYQNIDVDGFTQSGAFPINVSGYDQDSARLLAGYRAEFDAGKFTPYVSLTYAYELQDDDFGTTATIPGGAAFGVTGGGVDSVILISAGTNYAISDSLNANLGYNGEIAVGGDGVDSHGLNIGLNYGF